MTKAILLIGAIGFAGLPGTALADSSQTIQLVAHVDVFCRIYPSATDIIGVTNGSAVIGQVREICNTPSGYEVSTSFSNISTGRLNVGGSDYALINGAMVRSSENPAVRIMAWNLSNATVVNASEPVVMHVTISPR